MEDRRRQRIDLEQRRGPRPAVAVRLEERSPWACAISRIRDADKGPSPLAEVLNQQCMTPVQSERGFRPPSALRAIAAPAPPPLDPGVAWGASKDPATTSAQVLPRPHPRRRGSIPTSRRPPMASG